MSSMKSLFNTFFMALAAVAVASCVPAATEKKASCGANQAFDSVSRSCYSITEIRRVPTGTVSSASMAEETPKTIELSYTDANSDKALSCSVSGVSSNVVALSPLLTNGGLTAQANVVYSVSSNLATSIPMGVDTVATNAALSAMFTALDRFRTSYYQPTILTEVASFKAKVTTLLGIASNYPANSTVQSFYALTQTELAKLNPLIDQVTNNCQCTGGVCSTVIVPKLNKNGAAGFSYTITDKDGVSASKGVSISIAAMSTASAHLKPVAQSSYSGVFAESATSTASSYNVTLSGASDISGTAAGSMRYYFNGSKDGSNQGVATKGKVTGCMDLTGSTGLNDLTCVYTPNFVDGNEFDVTTPAIASATVGTDLTFTAKSEGTFGNAINVQYFNLQIDNTAIDPYVTTIEKFGLTDSTEAFIRMSGNAIKVFINPGVTSSYNIQELINNHPQAKRLVTVTGAATSPYVYPQPSIATPSAISLSGGVNGFDTIPYLANNLLTNSTNTATGMLRISATNDNPVAPRIYNSLFFQSETFLEAETKAVSLSFKDVDSTVFTFEAFVDTDTPTCNTNLTHAAYDMIVISPTNVNFTVNSFGAPACASGLCSVSASVSAVGNFAGNACLYYRVTDNLTAISEVQSVNVVVTNINDVPELSSSALPAITAFPATFVNEDLAVGLNSYTDAYVGPGGGVWEASQYLTVTLSSSNTALIPNTACTNYTPVSISPIGTIIPTAVGVKQFDKVNYRCYISTGTSSVNDWKLMPSLTAYPNCAYDYYGQGSPVGVVTPSASNKLYLDTTNNYCYKSSSTTSSSWARNPLTSNYKISYVPETDKSGTTTITITAKDNGGTANAAVDTVTGTIALTVNEIDDAPVYLSTITSIHTNEGGAVQSGAFQVNEDAGGTVDEDDQDIMITALTSDNQSVLPDSAISIFYDLNDNGVEDALEARTLNQALEVVPGAVDDASLHKFYLKLDPVDGVSGNANIQMSISDGTTTVTTNFSFIVHPVAALHGGWNNISSVGLKTDKAGSPVSSGEIQCNYNNLTDTSKCTAGTAACTGTSSPNSTIIPDAANVIYWDSSALKCYRSTGTTAFSWVEMNTSCPITRATGSCSNNNCITSSNPTGVTVPSFVGQYLFNSTSNTCYVSTGTTNADWITYVPAKVTLAWKPFILVGSGADSGVQIAGWNVYRREAGFDYNFKGGHLKNSTSTATFTIAVPTVRTFTDTTAVAGKVYYYVVRPVDTIRNFPTYTPEIFSEVRVLASPTNYSFVHRWIVNQEICNSMNITNTTTPNSIDQTNNFSCQYQGPGHTGGRYDYGSDLLVDTQEVGCPYAAAPRCSANGCIGIGAPSVTGGLLADDDLYYDRSAGTCYRYNTTGPTWTAMQSAPISAALANSLRSALNAPLVNLTQAKAQTICSSRAAPVLAGVTFGAVKLPSKKDFMAYSSQKLNITDPEITEMEQGFSLNIQSRCNGSSASGLETAFTDSSIPSTSFIYSLPGTFSSGIRSLYTGSIPWASSKGTEACVSRFGIQDLYGNVAEWTTDQMTCANNAIDEYSCDSTATSSYYYDFGGSDYYGFNLSTGPYNDSNGSGVINDVPPSSTPDGALTQWTFADELFSSEKFSFPTGMPISSEIVNFHAASAALDWILDIGPSNGITTSKLHEDGIIVNSANVSNAAGSFAVGGSYLSGNLAGRYTSELINTTTARPDVGLRCIIPITAYP